MRDDGLAQLRRLLDPPEPEPERPEPPSVPRFYRRREGQGHKTFMRFEYRVPGRQRRCR